MEGVNIMKDKLSEFRGVEGVQTDKNTFLTLCRCYDGWGERVATKDCIKTDLETPAIKPRDYLSLT